MKLNSIAVLVIGGLIGAFLANHLHKPAYQVAAQETRFVPVETVKVVKIDPPVIAEDAAAKCSKGCICSKTGKCVCNSCPNKLEATKAKATARQEYLYAREEAIEQGLPLVIGVGVDAPKGEWIAVRYDGFDTGDPNNDGLVVAVPHGKELKWYQVISPNAAPEEILADAKLIRKRLAQATQPVQAQPQATAGNCANGNCSPQGFQSPQMQGMAGGNCAGGSWGSGRVGGRRR